MLFVVLHVAIALMQFVPRWVQQAQGQAAARFLRSAMAIGFLPSVFSALCWILPNVHPEPYHLAWYRLDLLWCGSDATTGLRVSTPEWICLVLQLLYAAFYLLPIAAVLLTLRARGVAAFDRALAIVVGGFLLSYLGYLWFPTLAPKAVLPLDLQPSYALAGTVHQFLDDAEANPWDCFPSGHTMMSLCSALIVRRWAPRHFWLFALVASSIAISTLVLRYHWPIDVVVGVVAVPLWVRACDRLLDLDGAQPA